MKKIIIAIILIILGSTSYLFYSTKFSMPKRAYGLSAHWLPERIAAQDESGQAQAGFLSSFRTEDGEIARKLFKTPEDLILAFQSFPLSFRRNGIWLIITHPGTYSAKELETKEELIKLCRKNKIPLFICRGKDLPNGWKRY